MVTVKASHLVKPAGETPSGNMYLNDIDQLMPINHSTSIYVYKSPAVSDLSLSSITHLLTTSLSKALTIFYPLAARLDVLPRHRFQLNLNSAGALFLEAESVNTLEDYGDFCPTPSIGELIPQVDYTRPVHEIPLLIAQITKFGCGGFILGLGVHHSVGDGIASLYFVYEWARISRGESPERLPFIDRTIVNVGDNRQVDPFRTLDLDRPPALIDGPEPDEERRKETTVFMLKLTKEQIRTIQKIANLDPDVEDDNGRPFTRYETLSAHLWRCITKARGLNEEQPIRLRIISSFRNKINPPLPDNYFGNAIILGSTIAINKDVVSQPLGYVASKVRAGIKKVNNEYVKDLLARAKNVEDFNKLRSSPVVGNSSEAFKGSPTNVSIISWMGLTNAGVDFGWGKEIHMGPGDIGFDGKVYIFPRFADEDGSLTIALRLRKKHVDEFKRLFYENLSIW